MATEPKWISYIEKDKGPIIRWIATKLSDILISIEEKLMPYSQMWELDLDDLGDLDTPHNQMTLEDIDE